jgi:hypothetical protein
LQRIGNDAAFSMSYIISGKDRGCITYLSGMKPLAADVSFPPASSWDADDLGARKNEWRI